MAVLRICGEYSPRNTVIHSPCAQHLWKLNFSGDLIRQCAVGVAVDYTVLAILILIRYGNCLKIENILSISGSREPSGTPALEKQSVGHGLYNSFYTFFSVCCCCREVPDLNSPTHSIVSLVSVSVAVPCGNPFLNCVSSLRPVAGQVTSAAPCAAPARNCPASRVPCCSNT